MEKKNYFNFLAMRKCMYDIEMSERARLIYIHLLQKSSAKGSNKVELTKPQIAQDLGILTKDRKGLAIKNVQRALDELEDAQYITRSQKYKGEGVPLTITLNLTGAFLRQKQHVTEQNVDKNEQVNEQNDDKNEQVGSKKGAENVHPYNPSNPSLSVTNHDLSVTNHDLSVTNHDLSVTNHDLSDIKEEFMECKEKLIEKIGALTDGLEFHEVDTVQHDVSVYLNQYNEKPYHDRLKNIAKVTLDNIKEKKKEEYLTAPATVNEYEASLPF